MSLSSFLLPGTSKGKAKNIDQGLDHLFRSTAPVPHPSTITASSTPAAADAAASLSHKKRKAADAPKGNAKRSKPDASRSSKSAKSISAKPKKPESSEEDSEDESEPDEVDENAPGSAQSESDDDGKRINDHDADSSDSDDEGDPSKMMHESLLKGASAKTAVSGKRNDVPVEEMAEQRDARTIFVGNVAVEVARSQPAQKQLKRHLLAFVPSAKIESVRFRSVAFKNPTSELPADDDKGKSKAPQPKPKTREHDRERAASWRDADEAATAAPKQYLTPKEKKRVAFIKHEIHEQVDAVNAYVVFALPPSAAALARRPTNVPPLAPVMDPYTAAQECAEKADGSVFLGRTLRADIVKRGTAPGAEESTTGDSGMAGDPKATVFVGNLDFASKEEALRTFFEAIVKAERGEPGTKGKQKAGENVRDEEDDEESEGEGDGEDEDENQEVGKKAQTWVKRVRIVRDKDTQLGKGFAYVQFVDRECVDEILALDQTKLKFAKRKLRVQRCKTLPGGPKLRVARQPRTGAASATSSKNPHAGSSRPPPPPRFEPASRQLPRGNPALGQKLVGLSKEERKKAKATDPDRLARRLAKKRGKALAEKGVKSQVDRERVRKRPNDKKGGAKEGAKQKKRVRSGKAISKLNTKK
ncbi:uncharacterized protein BXZ73DRAFT_79221 [Epithele typhae]|uniref:uncharacterized protein n=1 Tax=Epithele typhae TaxID=378194 RepID=UPI002008E98F|nr:uncharacterized protein BXZ73DRAFT_79221 [Epithele typhae]KAH9924670.1 hypothetical protein BXZ73DRAFT_79221 [Epithele typhae]